MKCKVFIMVVGRKPCSRLCGGPERSCSSKPGKANARAVVFRELDSAPLNVPESGQPSRRGEASTGPEATTESKGWTLRGERRQRAQTEPSGTWEARYNCSAARPGQLWKGSHNFPERYVAASERSVVAAKFRLQSGRSQGALAKSC
jgi:hypothetical protein